MPLVSTSIPNLINGISQQPAEIRLSTQAERQINGLSSVARGLEKRPGTEHRTRVSIIDQDDLFIHSIRRDRNEEYTTILSRTSGGTKTLKAYDKDGVSVPVLHDTVSDASASTIVDGSHASVVVNADLGYLETGTTAGGVKDNIVATTVADTTFIINKTVTVTKATTAGKASGENEEGVNYTFTAATSDVITTSATHGLVNDDIVVLTTTGTLPAGLALSTNYYVLTTPAVNTLTLSATADGSVIDITGTGSGIHTITSVGGWISSVGYTSSGGSVDLDSTWLYEGVIYVKTGDYSSKYVVSIATIAAPTTYFKTGFQTPSSNAGVNQAYTATTRIAKIIKDGTSAVGGSVGSHGWDVFDSTEPIEGFGGWYPTANRDESGKTTSDAGYEGDTYYVSLAALATAQTNFAFSADASSSVIKVLSKVPFTIKCSDSSGGNDLVGFTTSVRSFSELPGVGVPDKYKVEVVGNADATQDNFFIEYNKTDKTWNECIGVSLATGLDIFTMPHRLVRLFDSQTPANIYFLYEPVKEVSRGWSSPRYGWTSRKSGDDLSNPFPTFVGGKINDICFHKNRFGILSDENIIFSTAGNYYNFFPISVMTSLASNPIDISVSNNEVSILKHAAAFDQSLLLFSDFQQFSLNSEGSSFSPSSVSVDVVTQFESTSQAPPVSSGKFVYFPFQRGDYSGVREYFVDLGASDTNDSVDITAHVPQYIKGNITKMIVSSTDQIIAVLSDDDLKRVYIYKQFWSDQKKLQNSWSHWTFDGDILNCAFLGSTLQLITKRLNTNGTIDGIYLEDINLSLDSAEAVMEDKTSVLLDRRVKLTYNQTVAANLPYYANIPANMVYVTDNARKLSSSTASLTRTMVNEYLALDATNVVYAGIPFTFEYEFSKFIHKENDLPVQTAKLQVRSIHLLYSNTGFFNIKVNVTPGTILIPDPNVIVLPSSIIVNTDATVTVSSTFDLVVGMPVSGVGVPSGTTVLSITDLTHFELSANATRSSTLTLTFNSGQTIASTPRINYSKNFSGMLTNTSSFGQYKLLSGTFKSSVMTNSANCNIILENDEYLPCAFMSAEWEGFLHTRSQRV